MNGDFTHEIIKRAPERSGVTFGCSGYIEIGELINFGSSVALVTWRGLERRGSRYWHIYNGVFVHPPKEAGII